MPTSGEVRVPKILYIVTRPPAPQACEAASAWAWAMLIALLLAILPWQVAAETTSPALSSLPEAAPGLLRQGIVTSTSNLRVSPSMHSEIVAVAKQGTRVKILLESGRWLQVRIDEAVEAWIYKPLVLIEPESIQSLSEAPVSLAPSGLAEAVPAAAVTPDVLVESPPQSTLEKPELEPSIPAPSKELHVLPLVTWTAWVREIWLTHFQGLAAHIVIVLTIALGLSIALQLRATRQLRWAMQEVGQLLDIVEEIYAGGVMAPRSDSGAKLKPVVGTALSQKAPPPGIEFSPTEDLVLQALSEQPVVQESELRKFLAEKGLTGVLIKAIIGDIVRKTEALGLPWVEVRYVQGRFRYRLRSDAPSNPGIQQAEKR